MAERDNSKQNRVTVHGQFTNTGSSEGVLHRRFHYQVNILQPQQQQVYDRVLHICEQDKPTPVVHIPIETMPPLTTEAIRSDTCDTCSHTLSTELSGSIQPSPGDSAPFAVEVTRHHTRIDPSVGTDATPMTPARIAFFSRAIRCLHTLLKPLSPLPILQQIQNRLIEAWLAIARFLPGLHRRIIFPDLKPVSTRQLFSHRSRNIAGKLGLIGACLMLVFVVVYFMPQKNSLIARLEPKQAARPVSPVKTHTPPAYHAIIEKHSDGVVITIQGPEYEEVLTRLPPGYLPVVQDNKIVHIVTPGNTLWFIAKRYIKNPYRYPELVRLNNIKNPDLIYPGDRVIIQYVRKPAT